MGCGVHIVDQDMIRRGHVMMIWTLGIWTMAHGDMDHGPWATAHGDMRTVHAADPASPGPPRPRGGLARHPPPGPGPGALSTPPPRSAEAHEHPRAHPKHVSGFWLGGGGGGVAGVPPRCVKITQRAGPSGTSERGTPRALKGTGVDPHLARSQHLEHGFSFFEGVAARRAALRHSKPRAAFADIPRELSPCGMSPASPTV